MFRVRLIGDLGKDHYGFVKKYNKDYGEGNWFWGFTANNSLYSWDWGMQLYEDAYWTHFRDNLSLLKRVVEHSNVFSLHPSDVESGLDYRKQTGLEHHYEDIAIRRCLRRLGLWFKGKGLLNIHNTPLNPHSTKFHLKHLLSKNEDSSIYNWIENHRVAIIAEEIEDQIKLSDILIR